MSLRALKWLTILLPTAVIGGFEIIRHEFLLGYISMEFGNLLIVILTFVTFFIFATWLFNKIKQINERLTTEQSKKVIYEERERIARELHDNIAQILFFLNVMLKQRKIEEAQSAVYELDQHVRQSIFNLKSFSKDTIIFADRLRRWIDEWSELSGIQVDQQINIPKEFYTTKQEIELFAIIQEAFTNIRKHSKATSASISFSIQKNKWTLFIKDNGVGVYGLVVDNKKYGLSIMKKRAEELGATLDMNKRIDGGTEILVRGGTKSEI